MQRKVPIWGQINEVEREIVRRQREYPALVRAVKMRQNEADLCLERMNAVRQTLLFCKEHEADFHAYIAAKKAGTL